MEKYLKKLELSENLTLQESVEAFEILMNGKANDNEIYNFLTLLSKKGEVSTEIAGGVSVLRNKAKKVNVDDCIDTCCLLYTSPSPRDKRQSRMPSSA